MGAITGHQWFGHWFRLPDPNFADQFTVPPRSTVTALSRYPDHIDLFVVGYDGGVYSTFWDVNGGWFGHWFARAPGSAGTRPPD